MPALVLAALILSACSASFADSPPTFDAQSAPADNVPPDSPSTAAPAIEQTAGGPEEAAAAPAEVPTEIPPTATPEEPFPGEGPWQVTFEADGEVLSGTMYGEGETALVLVPMYPGGQEGWQAFALQAAGAGYRALTFDLRGRGESEGEPGLAEGAADVRAAAALLREHGAESIIIMGGGPGTIPAIQVASQDDVAGLALLSPLTADDGAEIDQGDLQALTVPSLWLGARTDMTQQAEEMAAQAANSDTEVWIYEGTSLRGTYLFEGSDSADVARRLLEFAARVAGG